MVGEKAGGVVGGDTGDGTDRERGEEVGAGADGERWVEVDDWTIDPSRMFYVNSMGRIYHEHIPWKPGPPPAGRRRFKKWLRMKKAWEKWQTKA